jgi:hypothetical protein
MSSLIIMLGIDLFVIDKAGTDRCASPIAMNL